MLSRIIFWRAHFPTIGLVPNSDFHGYCTVLGMYAGFYGGKVDFIIMRPADVMSAFPSLAAVGLVVVHHGRRALINIFHCVEPGKLAGTARIVRSQTLL